MKNYFTDSIHEVIGNSPVLDQYDESYPASFYGSTQDDYITGSMLALDEESTKIKGKKVYIQKDRGKIFSKLYSSIQPPLDSTYGSEEVIKNSSYAERLIPWSEKVSHSYRITQCIDENERFYDSCLPDIKKCFEADQSNTWYSSDTSTYWLSPYGNIQSTEDTGYLLFNSNPITSQEISNNIWTWSFPYEDRYKPAERLLKSDDLFKEISTNIAVNWYPISFTSIKEKQQARQIKNFFPILPGKKQIDVNDVSFRLDASLSENGPGSYRLLIPSDINLNNKSTPAAEYLTSSMSNNDMIKFLFGFGDLNNVMYTKYTLNDDEDDEERIISSSYFTGFEVENWTVTPPSGGPLTFYSSSLTGSPIPISGSEPNYFNAQLDQPAGNVIVKWIAPSASIGLANGYIADKYVFRAGNWYPTEYEVMGMPAGAGTAGAFHGNEIGWQEYPWILVARESYTSASFDGTDMIQVYNYVSQSTYSYYGDENSTTVLTGERAIYWNSGSSPSRQWVLGSFLSHSVGSSGETIYKMPHPKFKGGKTVSTQKVEITSSLPWKLAYQRTISSHKDNYFRTSFSGMPGLPASLGSVDVEIERLYGTDTNFEGTSIVETTPQTLSDFTSSLYPPGSYRVNFSHVKTNLTGSDNYIERSFIDNISVLTYDQNQLTSSFDPNFRIGYSHYPEFRQVIRDSRTSPYFPGTGLKNISQLNIDVIKKLAVFDKSIIAAATNTITSPSATSPSTSNIARASSNTITKPKFDQFVLKVGSNTTKKLTSTLPKTTAIFNINPSKISTANQLSTVKRVPDVLATLTVLDETSRYLKDSSYGGYEIAISPVIRGWKYGLYSGFPAHSRAIFRRNRFGQFRDMLEQRPMTVFYNTDSTSTFNVSKGSNSKIKESSNKTFSIQDGPVSVKFVKQIIEIDNNNLGKIITNEIDPKLTTSQNLSKHAVSSIPYFDEENKERALDKKDSKQAEGIEGTLMVTSAAPLAQLTSDQLTETLNTLSTNLTILTKK